MKILRNARNILDGKRGRKRQLGKPRRKWENSIRINLKVGRCGLDSFDSG
jgi:hypothetical protein